MKLRHIDDIPAIEPVTYEAIAFLSLVPLGTGFLGAYREFTPARSNVETHIRAVELDRNFAQIGPSCLIHSNGHDPRAFLYQGHPYALIAEWKGGSNCDCDQVLVDLVRGTRRTLNYAGAFAGKNWMPVQAPGPMRFIRSIDPVVMYVEDSPGQELRCTRRGGNDIDPIGMFRGGAAARLDGSRIVGFAHTTISADEHVPAYFELEPNSLKVQSADFDRIGDDGIIDPTSWVGDRLVCCCTRENWWIPQPIHHRVYQVELD